VAPYIICVKNWFVVINSGTLKFQPNGYLDTTDWLQVGRGSYSVHPPRRQNISMDISWQLFHIYIRSMHLSLMRLNPLRQSCQPKDYPCRINHKNGHYVLNLYVKEEFVGKLVFFFWKQLGIQSIIQREWFLNSWVLFVGGGEIVLIGETLDSTKPLRVTIIFFIHSQRISWKYSLKHTQIHFKNCFLKAIPLNNWYSAQKWFLSSLSI